MDGKIACIKRLREAFGLGLLEAKRICDGDYKFTDHVDVAAFNDNGMSMVPYERLRMLEAAAREREIATRVNEQSLDEYYQARKRSEQLTRQMDRLAHKLDMVRETYVMTRNRIVGR